MKGKHVGREKEHPMEHLNRYFILRLIAIMGCILLAEVIVNESVSKWMIPAVNAYIRTEVFPAGISSAKRIGMMFLILGIVILRFLYLFFGEVFPKPVLFVLGNLVEKNIVLEVESMESGNLFFLFVIMIGILFCYLLPCMIGIFIYSQMVVEKVEKIREYDRKQQEMFTQRRNLLLSDVAHDLKTPITTVAGYAQALNDHMVESKEKQEEYLKAIYAKSMQMSHMITLLFDYVKLDSEGFVLKKEDYDLAELLRICVAGVYMDVEQAGMELEAEIPEERCMAQIDSMQLMRAVTNLLVNAMKHNPKGTKILISMEGQPKEWVIRIADSGVKIEEKLAEHIFDPFVMGDASRSQNRGSGLGLGIASKIIQMHDGSLALEQQNSDEKRNGNSGEYTKAFCIKIPRRLTGENYEYQTEIPKVILHP